MDGLGLVDIVLDSDNEVALEDVYHYLMGHFPLWTENDLPIRKLPNQQRWRLRFTVETMECYTRSSAIALI